MKKNYQKHSVASIDIHAQKTFTSLCPDELPVPDGDTIVAELNAQAAFAGKRIGTKEAHNPKAIWLSDAKHPTLSTVAGDNVDVRWPPHSIVGSKGFELIDGLPSVTEHDFFVWEGIELDMHPYGVCYHDHAEKLSTGLLEYLTVNHIELVIVGGLATDYCVKTSVLQLLRARLAVIVNLAACRGLAADTVEQALADMRKAGAIFVQSAAELTSYIKS